MQNIDLIEKLENYLQNKLNNQNIRIGNWREVKGGWETDIFIITLTNLGGINDTIVENVVLRMYSGDSGVNKAKAEYNTLNLLYKSQYSVPKVFLVEESAEFLGKPFIIMEEIKGKLLDEYIHSNKALVQMNAIKNFAQTFFDLHNVDWTPFVTDAKSYRENTKTNLLAILDDFSNRIKNNSLDELLVIADWIKNEMENIEYNKLACIHKDFHPANVIVSEIDEKLYVIDWHEILIYDYRIDLAWTLILLHSHWSERIRDLVLDEYESIRGSKTENFPFFEVIALFIRIGELALTFKTTSTTMGLRSDAIDQMKNLRPAFRILFQLLEDRVGIRLPNTEKLIFES